MISDCEHSFQEDNGQNICYKCYVIKERIDIPEITGQEMCEVIAKACFF